MKPKKNKMRKCATKGCNRQIEDKFLYCSIECAIYDGAFSVNKEKTPEKIGQEIYQRLYRHAGGTPRMTKWMLIKLVANAIKDERNEKKEYLFDEQNEEKKSTKVSKSKTKLGKYKSNNEDKKKCKTV